MSLGSWVTSGLSRLVATFLNHVKTNRLPPDLLRARARDSGARKHSEAFLDVFEQVRSRYEGLMGGERDSPRP